MLFVGVDFVDVSAGFLGEDVREDDEFDEAGHFAVVTGLGEDDSPRFLRDVNVQLVSPDSN